MAKVVRHLKDAQKEFQKVFDGLCYTKSSWQVWSDFVTAVAVAIANAFDRTGPVHDEREKAYASTMKRYTEQEQLQFPVLLSIMVNELDAHPEQDFLGEMFMALELGNHWKGQFFTPYDICKAMAAMTMGDASLEERIDERGWVGINDPACGAGALLIAARNVLVQKNRSFYETLFVAQDIDRTAALMCYIQLSLLGCAGYVVIADTICHPVTGPSLLDPIKTEYNDIWFTPMFFTEIWQGRRFWHRIDRTMRAMKPAPVATPPPPPERPVTAPAHVDASSEPELVLRATEAGQLTLF